MKQIHGAECKVAFWLCFLYLVHFQFFLILKKFNTKRLQHEKSATWKNCNMEIDGTSKMESFATIFNGFVNYCCKALHLRLLWGSWQHLWK